MVLHDLSMALTKSAIFYVDFLKGITPYNKGVSKMG